VLHQVPAGFYLAGPDDGPDQLAAAEALPVFADSTVVAAHLDP
jgi:hypothetical protein